MGKFSSYTGKSGRDPRLNSQSSKKTEASLWLFHKFLNPRAGLWIFFFAKILDFFCRSQTLDKSLGLQVKWIFFIKILKSIDTVNILIININKSKVKSKGLNINKGIER
jgi:hypothetical protein